MIASKFYRRFCVFFGARSFEKYSVKSDTYSYCLIKGDSTKIVPMLASQGFVEEWPRKTFL